MRLVEVVMLMGAHCVSPVEHSQLMTDAAKVQCAVVIEKDTEAGTLKVTPEAATRDPQVAAAVARFGAAPVDPAAAGSTRIVPAWAPAGSPTTEVKIPESTPMSAAPPVPPAAIEPVPGEATQDATQPPPPPEPKVAASKPEKKVAVLAPPKQKAAPAKTVARKKQTVKVAAAPLKQARCKGAAVAKWYKTADGHKKFRCVKPASDSAPDQLY